MHQSSDYACSAKLKLVDTKRRSSLRQNQFIENYMSDKIETPDPRRGEKEKEREEGGKMKKNIKGLNWRDGQKWPSKCQVSSWWII